MGRSRTSNVKQSLLPVHDSWEWQYQGACKNMDTEIFFLDHGTRAHKKKQQEQRAISVCKKCPVISQCLEHALKVPEYYGVWGGMTAEQRMSIIYRSNRRQ